MALSRAAYHPAEKSDTEQNPTRNTDLPMSFERVNEALFAWLGAGHPTGAARGALIALAQAPVWGVPFVIGALWLFGARVDRKAAVTAGLSACLAMVLAHLASGMIDNPRPFAMGLAPNPLDHAADSSFPSDHATLLFALAASFALRPPPCAPWLAALYATVGVAVGAARVALGLHFPLDVVGAAGLALASALAVMFGLGRLDARLMTIGEGLRGRIGFLAARDRREWAVAAGGGARPPR